MSAPVGPGRGAAPPAALSLSSVSKHYRSAGSTVVAVDGATFSVEPGTLACLYGRSGSGKSTLLNLVAGLDVPDAGQVMVLGRDVARMSESERCRLRLEHVGVVFQEHNLIEEFTALENVALPLQAGGTPRRDAVAAATAGLERVGLRGLEHRTPRQMSGGQRQRVGIARALVGQRSLLVADEPTGALDAATSHALFALLRRLCAEGSTALVATHDPIARDYADVLLEIESGQVTGESLPRPEAAASGGLAR